ncbi:MAG: formyltransferase family protein, partial [Leeuwenhoekiella sp.]
EDDLIQLLTPYDPEVLINCFCNFKFVKLLTNYRCYNVHPSYLPLYRGRHPLQWSLINGEKTHGITVHEMSKKYDDGPIIWQENIFLNENMSVAQLREELMLKLANAFPQVLNQILTKSAEKQVNSTEKSTYIKRRSQADSQLTEWYDAALLYRKIKALRSENHPAFLLQERDEKLNIIDVEREENNIFSAESKQPKLLKIKKQKFLIQTADARLLWLFSAEELPSNFKINFTQ